MDLQPCPLFLHFYACDLPQQGRASVNAQHASVFISLQGVFNVWKAENHWQSRSITFLPEHTDDHVPAHPRCVLLCFRSCVGSKKYFIHFPLMSKKFYEMTPKVSSRTHCDAHPGPRQLSMSFFFSLFPLPKAKSDKGMCWREEKVMQCHMCFVLV